MLEIGFITLSLTYEYIRWYHFFMFKKVLFLLVFLLLFSPAFAGELEDQSRLHSRILLYLYTPECGYCRQFDTTYQKLNAKYGQNCKFIKINANTEYGNELMRMFNAFYVPYVMLINNEKRTVQRIAPECLMNGSCMKDAIVKFIK